MTTFVLTIFGVYLIVAVFTLAELAGDHPRHRSPASVGFDAATLIIQLAIVVWAAFLLWGRA